MRAHAEATLNGNADAGSVHTIEWHKRIPTRRDPMLRWALCPPVSLFYSP
jgi:hypothetical protein